MKVLVNEPATDCFLLFSAVDFVKRLTHIKYIAYANKDQFL